MMRLPPDDSDDITPAECSIKTINVSELATVDLGDGKTDIIDHGRISLHTLVRARSGAREAALEDCARKCRLIYLSWRRGMVTGAGLTGGVIIAVVAGVWAWLRWWR